MEQRGMIDSKESMTYTEPKGRVTVDYNVKISLEEVEIEWVEKSLKYHDGNISAAAKALGVSRSKLYRRVEHIRQRQEKR